MPTPSSRSSLALFVLALLAGAVSLGCIAAAPEEDLDTESEAEFDEALTPGANGGACTQSPYNCKLRVEGGNVVDNSKGGLWAVADATVVDGNGDPMGVNTRDHLRFNYGQTRHMKGTTFVYARSTSTNSGGWFPIDAVAGEESLRQKVGEVNARDTGGDRLGCYKVRSSHDEALVEKKVVYDAQGDYERAGDYLSLPRANGGRYANMAFNVPGFGLGGPAIDIWPAGTKFRRVAVPTSSGKPSISIPLWVKDGSGRYRKQSGAMTFVYGYVVSETGPKRFGWMSYDALTTTTGCP